MRKVFIILGIIVLSLFVINCDDKDKKKGLLPYAALVAPEGVPQGDLVLQPPPQEGGGEVISLCGDSKTTDPTATGTDTSCEKSQENSNSGTTTSENTSGTTSGSTTSGATTGENNGTTNVTGDTTGGSTSGSTSSSTSGGTNVTGENTGGTTSGSTSSGSTSGGNVSDEDQDEEILPEDTCPEDDPLCGEEYDASQGGCNIKDNYDKHGHLKNGYHKGKSKIRHAKDYCYLEGTWYKDGNTMFTYMNDKAIGFRFDSLKSGKYKIWLQVKMWVKEGSEDKKNKDALPNDFKEFKIQVDADGATSDLTIPASTSKWEKGFVTLDLTGGKTDLLISWINANKDANFQLKKIKLHKIGKSSRSAITAYLMNISTKKPVWIIGLLVICGAAVAAITIIRKKRAQQA